MSTKNSNYTDNNVVIKEKLTKKVLFNLWDLIIKDNINDGCMFFFVTINSAVDSNIIEKIIEYNNILTNKVQLLNFNYSIVEFNKRGKKTYTFTHCYKNSDRL